MPFLLATSLRRWLLVTIAVPLAAAGARRLARAVESRRGPSGLTRGLTRAADTAHRGRADAGRTQTPAGRSRGGLLRRRSR